MTMAPATLTRSGCAGCAAHVLGECVPLFEATYFAQHGAPCPYSEEFEAVLNRIAAVTRRGED